MEFAKRTSWDLSPNALSREIEVVKSSGKDVLDLTISNPTQCGFDYPQEMLNCLSDQQAFLYEVSPQGLIKAREAVCCYYALRGVSVNPDRVWLTSSTSEAYTFLFRLLADPNDTVVFPRPSYPLFDFLAQMNDLKTAQYALRYHDGWSLDKESFEQAIDGSTVKAVIIVNPNNPTGSCLKDEEIAFIFDRLRAKKILLICDEVFLDYPLGNSSLASLLASMQQDVFVCVLNGLSKVLALPQMKLSWIIMSGPEDAVRQASRRLEVVADTYLSVNTPVQLALTSWVEYFPRIQNQIRERLDNNAAFLKTTIEKVYGAEVLKADGGWNAIVALPDGMDEERFVMTCLQDCGVIVYPGYFFDFCGEAHVVISLLVDEEVFSKGVTAVTAKMKEGQRGI